jgi:hypothetical protein
VSGMGGTVTAARRLTQAEDSAVMLQQAARGGAPLMIPGALEPRASRPPARPAAAPADPAPPRAGAAADDSGRLEREREGGGAASERTGRRSTTILARLWRYMLGME